MAPVSYVVHSRAVARHLFSLLLEKGYRFALASSYRFGSARTSDSSASLPPPSDPRLLQALQDEEQRLPSHIRDAAEVVVFYLMNVFPSAHSMAQELVTLVQANHPDQSSNALFLQTVRSLLAERPEFNQIESLSLFLQIRFGSAASLSVACSRRSSWRCGWMSSL